MKILLHISHPAQFHMFYPLIQRIKEDGHGVDITINTKDILEDLIKSSGLKYTNILKKRRKKNSKFAAMLTLLAKDRRLFNIVLKGKYDLLIGTESALAHVGFLLRKKVLTFNEDDADVIKEAAAIAFPFTTAIVSPRVCQLGKYENKKIAYEGYQKMAYLAPKYFKPDEEVLKSIGNNKFFLIRLSGLSAYHDREVNGFNQDLLEQIISMLEPKGKVYISSENELPSNLEAYKLICPVDKIHSVLYYADLLICDSQSMAVEAAILGTPSIRYNSLVGRISVLEELEHKYQLTFGVKSPNSNVLLDKVAEVMQIENDEIWNRRKETMLSDKDDVVNFWYEIIISFLIGRKK